MTSLSKSLRSSLDPYAVWILNSMYDLSGTGKKGGFKYQLDLRIRHTCFNAIGHNDGLFNTDVINGSNTRAFIYEYFQNPLERGFPIPFVHYCSGSSRRNLPFSFPCLSVREFLKFPERTLIDSWFIPARPNLRRFCSNNKAAASMIPNPTNASQKLIDKVRTIVIRPMINPRTDHLMFLAE